LSLPPVRKWLCWLRSLVNGPTRREACAGVLALVAAFMLLLLSPSPSFSGALTLREANLELLGNPAPDFSTAFTRLIEKWEVRAVSNGELSDCSFVDIVPSRCLLRSGSSDLSAKFGLVAPTRVAFFTPAKWIGTAESCKLELKLQAHGEHRLELAPRGVNAGACVARAEMWLQDTGTATLQTSGEFAVNAQVHRAPAELRIGRASFVLGPASEMTLQLAKKDDSVRLWAADSLRVARMSGRLSSAARLLSPTGHGCEIPPGVTLNLSGAALSVRRSWADFGAEPALGFEVEQASGVEFAQGHCSGSAPIEVVKNYFELAGGLFAAFVVALASLRLTLAACAKNARGARCT